MKNKITLLLLCASFALTAQQKIKFSQIEDRNFNINGVSQNLLADRTYTTNFIPTLVKSSSYTIAPFEFVPVDISAGSVTLTLPAGPTDRTYQAFKIINTLSSNTLTVKTGTTSDVFNRVGGVTSFTLNSLNQGYQLLYSTLTKVWYIISDDLPSTYLDTKYWSRNGNTTASSNFLGSTDSSQVLFKANNSQVMKLKSLNNENTFTLYENSVYPQSKLVIGPLSTYGFSVAAMYLGTPNLGATNYFAWSDSSIMRVNGQHTLQFLGTNIPWLTAVPEKTVSGTFIALETTNKDSVAANASINHLNIRANKIGWKTGTTASQNKILVASDTYSAPVTATITNAIALNVSRPTQGTNMVFTNPAWAAQFTGNFNVSGNTSFGSALLVPLGLLHLAAPPTSTCAIKFTTHTIPTLNAGEVDYNSVTGFNWGSPSVWAGAVTTPSVFGAAASGGTLFLGSTSNATKGAINFGTGMTFDAVNKTLTIGSLVTGTKTLSVIGNADISSSLTTNGLANTGTLTTGNFTAATGYFSGLLTPTVGIKGTTTNDNATALNVGEYVSSLLAVGSAGALTTNTTLNVTSISLTAGDWDVTGNVNFNETSSTVSARSAGITSTSATIPVDGSEGNCGVQSTLTSEVNTISLARKRFSLSGTTTIYLVGRATFSAGSCGAYGTITARRVR